MKSAKSTIKHHKTSWLVRCHVDAILLIGLIALTGVGLITLYSAAGQDIAQMERQLTRLGVSFLVMLGLAQLPIMFIRRLSPVSFGVGVLMLVAVIFFGDMGKGAQRWLSLGIIRFQPSEVMKIAMPLAVAYWVVRYGLPPRLGVTVVSLLIIGLPFVVIGLQPDLGTALLVAASGVSVIFMAGISWWQIMLFHL